ncbi:MAG: carbamoyltransferase HypF [Candidatus Aminicenantes bacterium]|nr:carbamoyltransferase HypF [Candidatus Aminicenantes bacterium]
MPAEAVRVLVTGVVQGVGFRPFVYKLAEELRLRGWVRNRGCGVEIHLEGGRSAAAARAFLRRLRAELPPLAVIEDVSVRRVRPEGASGFRIKASAGGERFVFISPDIAACDACLGEVMTPGDRRHLYPFANCTDCGPRYTIVRSLPYDRPATTMAGFPMCPDCRREYEDPRDRRYHAQPIACPACGPRVRLSGPDGAPLGGGVDEAADRIRRGRIVAVKGLGGFHLMCDALNAAAVGRLRRLKARSRKPLALMAADLAAISRYAALKPAEREAIVSPQRPIVLLAKKAEIPSIAPGLAEIGVMLPSTPLHALLLRRVPLVVATSSNPKDAPIMKDAGEGVARLADFVLDHDRPIQVRSDDSVLRIAADGPLFVRRARGYVPYPQRVPDSLNRPVRTLALGGELKDTLSLYKKGRVVTSQFLGDLDDYRNYGYFRETLDHLKRLFEVEPEVVVSDLHPDFRTTRFARSLGIAHLRVQHHFAHVLAPLLEHGVDLGRGAKVLGIAMDGYGYGDDGQAWGGEFLLCDYRSYLRLAHFAYVPLPGGDLAAREPWRMALAHLHRAGLAADAPPRLFARVARPAPARLARLLDRGAPFLRTSSCGRLFDAVSFLAGLAPSRVEYEAEAPQLLEARAKAPVRSGYGFALDASAEPWTVSFAPLFGELLADLKRGTPAEVVSSKFHATLAAVMVRVAERARKERGVDTVSLAGGVFLNRRLVDLATAGLRRKGFRVLRSVLYSPNDESLSLGQTAFALAAPASAFAPAPSVRRGRRGRASS